MYRVKKQKKTPISNVFASPVAFLSAAAVGKVS
jgi:hypothetical protein